MPIPKDKEKKACDKAPLTTLGVILLISGTKKKVTPAMALSRVKTNATIIISITNKVGIKVLAALSMPSFTPAARIKLTMPATATKARYK